MRIIESGVRPFTVWNAVKQSDRIIIASESLNPADVIDADAHNTELLADRLSVPVRRTPIEDVVVAS